jgi:hypothetical protein
MRPTFPLQTRTFLLVTILAIAAACGTGADTSASDGGGLPPFESGTSDSAAASPSVGAATASASVGLHRQSPTGRSAAAHAASPREEALTMQVAPAPPPSPAARRQAAGASQPSPPPPAALAAEQSTMPSMVIRTGHAVLEVDSLAEAMARVHAAAQRLGGWVANSAMEGGRNDAHSATLEVKVPAARFDELVRGLEPIGHVESVNVNAEDVGEEFVDVQARVANARRLEERLVVLLATRTGRLDDVLAVERELARVREEIERYDGRLRFLRTRVAVSTLTVTVHEPPPIVGRVQGSSPIAEAVRQGWRNFVWLVAVAIAASGVLIPLALVAGAGYLLWRRWDRRRPAAPASVGTMTE